MSGRTIPSRDRLIRLSGIIGERDADGREITPPIIPVSERTWERGVRDGRFPKPVRLGRTVAWRESDILALVKDGALDTSEGAS